jgi:hypothetical protein
VPSATLAPTAGAVGGDAAVVPATVTMNFSPPVNWISWFNVTAVVLARTTRRKRATQRVHRRRRHPAEMVEGVRRRRLQIAAQVVLTEIGRRHQRTRSTRPSGAECSTSPRERPDRS